MSPEKVITRFAPSPTGYLHVGGARTALFSWLLARHHGGQYLLRIEDTDTARSTREAMEQLLEDLRWLGLNWDNPKLVIQSQRLDIYNAILSDLLAKGLAYKAYETSEELDAMRKAAEREKRPFLYRRRALTDEQIRAYEAQGRPHVVRFVMPVKEYRYTDEVLGDIVMPAEEAQDFVIRKSDGLPTFHFAVVVDDAEMGITHVTRGQDHVKNTFLHIALQEALGYRRPVYAHLTTILNPESGQRLSKRDRDRRIRQRVGEWMKGKKSSNLAAGSGIPQERIDEWLKNDKSQLDLSEQARIMPIVGLKESDLPEIMVHDFRKNGYLPEVLNNFLALCGWNPGGDREQMSMDEMVKLFELRDIGKSNAKFNRDKLVAFNTDACKAALHDRPVRLVSAFRDYLVVNPGSPLNKATDEQLLAMLKMKEGFRTLRQVDEASGFLFIDDDAIEYDTSAVEKVLLKQDRQGAVVLQEVAGVLAGVSEWNAPALETAVQAYCDRKQLALGKVAQPIRVAISGSTVSPPIFQTLEMLGRSSTLARIQRCLKQNQT